MKAITVDEPGNEDAMKLGEAPAPVMQPDSLRIRVAASAVNRADLLQRQGLYPPPPGASPILGLECAGEVVEVADFVPGWNVGDRAMALLAGGGYAEEVVVHAGSAMHVPDRLGIEEAAAIPEVFLTVFLNVFQLGGLATGGAALIHGGGSGIGTAAIQLVKAAGATVIVTAGSDEKCARCRELGADVAVNYRSGDFAAEAKQATGGRGVDVVLDSIGAPYLRGNLDALAVGGRLVVIGLMGGAKAELSLAALLTRRLQLIGSTLRARPVEEKAEIVAGFLARFGAALESGEIHPVVHRSFALANAAAAHRLVKASEHFGKVLLQVS
ncbi:MAG: NAD(P)H-quinone oxidoreductase [Deltaproteobacteria bacterium]|nr:NAD(P)H-quinone oxidoreductase [Deltaproteobacteria bacterium]MBW2666835.1 NAD(P)H-quinone oxidoreductase [Deltaproteobacteria bacterium]